MTYLSPALIKYAISSETTPLSILYDPKNRSVLLVTLGHFVFLEGGHRGDAIEARYIEDFHGASVGPLQVEIDPTSAFDPQTVPPPSLSLVRRDKILYVRGMQRGRNGSSDQGILCNLIEGMERSSTGNGAGFYRWRLISVEDDQKSVVHEIDVTPTK